MRRKISAAWPHSTPLCLLLYRKPAQKARTVLLQPRHGGKIRIFPAKNRQRNTAKNFLEKFQKFFQKGVAFCKVLWYNNQAFRKRNAQLNMGVFPSGQWGQTVNLLRNASVVRIHPRPPKNLSKDCCFSRDFCFLMFWNPLAMSTHRFSINFCRKCTADIHTRNILSKSVKNLKRKTPPANSDAVFLWPAGSPDAPFRQPCPVFALFLRNYEPFGNNKP